MADMPPVALDAALGMAQAEDAANDSVTTPLGSLPATDNHIVPQLSAALDKSIAWKKRLQLSRRGSLPYGSFLDSHQLHQLMHLRSASGWPAVERYGSQAQLHASLSFMQRQAPDSNHLLARLPAPADGDHMEPLESLLSGQQPLPQQPVLQESQVVAIRHGSMHRQARHHDQHNGGTARTKSLPADAWDAEFHSSSGGGTLSGRLPHGGLGLRVSRQGLRPGNMAVATCIEEAEEALMSSSNEGDDEGAGQGVQEGEAGAVLQLRFPSSSHATRDPPSPPDGHAPPLPHGVHIDRQYRCKTIPLEASVVAQPTTALELDPSTPTPQLHGSFPYYAAHAHHTPTFPAVIPPRVSESASDLFIPPFQAGGRSPPESHPSHVNPCPPPLVPLPSIPLPPSGSVPSVLSVPPTLTGSVPSGSGPLGSGPQVVGLPPFPQLPSASTPPRPPPASSATSRTPSTLSRVSFKTSSPFMTQNIQAVYLQKLHEAGQAGTPAPATGDSLAASAGASPQRGSPPAAAPVGPMRTPLTGLMINTDSFMSQGSWSSQGLWTRGASGRRGPTLLVPDELQQISGDDLVKERELGRGSTGSVWLAKWRGVDVALKELLSGGLPCAQDTATSEGPFEEAQRLASLRHPCIICLYGIVAEPGCCAMAVEYMRMGNLKCGLRLLRQQGIDSIRVKAAIALQAARGMEYLHMQQIVHFDLKCENLLCDLRDLQRPVVKIGDLGLSQQKKDQYIAGNMRGTLPFMAPELFYGTSIDGGLHYQEDQVTEKVDVYSFGVCLWEIWQLCGTPPYSGMPTSDIFAGVLTGTLRPEIPEHTDGAWSQLMQACWHGDPSLRPSFTEVAEVLEALLQSLPEETPEGACLLLAQGGARTSS